MNVLQKVIKSPGRPWAQHLNCFSSSSHGKIAQIHHQQSSSSTSSDTRTLIDSNQKKQLSSSCSMQIKSRTKQRSSEHFIDKPGRMQISHDSRIVNKNKEANACAEPRGAVPATRGFQELPSCNGQLSDGQKYSNQMDTLQYSDKYTRTRDTTKYEIDWFWVSISTHPQTYPVFFTISGSTASTRVSCDSWWVLVALFATTGCSTV